MAQTNTQSVAISPSWQIAFISVMVLTWLSSFWYLIIDMAASYISSGTWTYQLVLIGTPLVWFGVSLAYMWRSHKEWLGRIFSAMLLTFVGYGVYVALSSLEEALRMRFYPPVITNASDDSLWTAFGHEWLMAALAFVLFVSVLYIMRWRAGSKR